MNYEKALEIAKQDLIYKCTECTKANDILSQCRRKCNETYRQYVRYTYANIPRELWDLEIDDFSVSAKLEADKESRIKALQTIRLYIDNLPNAFRKGLGVVLYGFHGTGKSMLAACIMKEAIKIGKKVRMMEFNDITSTIRRAKQDIEMMEQLENDIETVDFLCIENFGVNQFIRKPEDVKDKEKDSAYLMRGPDFMTREIARLLNNRRRAMLPNVITTYYDMETLKFQDEEARQIMSTIVGHCTQVWLAGEDYRKTVLSQNWDKRIVKR